MTVVTLPPLRFSPSDNDLAKLNGLMDSSMLDAPISSQELGTLPSFNFDQFLRTAVPSLTPAQAAAAEDATVPQHVDMQQLSNVITSGSAAALGSNVTRGQAYPTTTSAVQLPPIRTHSSTLPALRTARPALHVSLPGEPSPMLVPLANLNEVEQHQQQQQHDDEQSAASELEASSSPSFAASDQDGDSNWDSSAATGRASAAARTVTSKPTQQHSQQQQAPLSKGKRKAPAIDLSTIEDPQERKKQRRLAKNRVTAALSRERKKAQMANLQNRVKKLEADNAHLAQTLAQRDAELEKLRGELGHAPQAQSRSMRSGGLRARS
jgi:cyclic AMP-dependent transcription factor ATF-2